MVSSTYHPKLRNIKIKTYFCSVKKSFAQILGTIENDRNRKIKAKLPSWAETEGLEYPSSLSLEQCSSEATALYKAGIIRGKSGSGVSLFDLTGGLGVDSLAFSEVCDRVTYNEINPVLAAAAEKNFATMGARNIRVRNTDSSDLLEQEWHSDWIYIDPARRDAAGKKVFLLEDCSPNVLELMPELWNHTDRIMLKLSPMADITMIAGRLGGCLDEVHVVGSGGECKELLCLLSRTARTAFSTTVAELSGGVAAIETFTEKETIGLSGIPASGDTVFEPSAALMKSGYADTYCKSLSFGKLDGFTHLYSKTGSAGKCGFGKAFSVVETVDFNGANIRSTGRKYPEADVSAKNIPVGSEELRKRLGTRSGNGLHIFGASVCGEKKLIVCRRIT